MPEFNSLHISRALSNISLAFRNQAYISLDILGRVPVMNETDLYWSWVRDFREVPSRRANGAVANDATWSATQASYTLYEDALKDIITGRDIANADAPFNLQRDTTEFLTDKVWLNIERRVSQLMFTTTSWSSNAGITATGWGLNTTTSLPILNVHSAASNIELNGLATPNTVIIGNDTFHAMMQNADILDRIKYTERGMISKELLASAFDVPGRLFVGAGIRDTSKEGQAESLARLWAGDALVGYFAPTPSLKTPTAAYMLQRTGHGNPWRVKTWRDEARDGTQVEVSAMMDAVLVSTQSAYLFKGASGV